MDSEYQIDTIDTNEFNANVSDTNEFDANESNSNEFDTNEFGTNELDTNQLDENELDSNDPDNNDLDNNKSDAPQSYGVQTTANEILHLQTRIHLKMLNTEFVALFRKNETGYALLITPEVQQSSGMTLKTIVSEINELIYEQGVFIEEKHISDQLQEISKQSGSAFDLDALMLKLNQVFLYIIQDNDVKKVEYAFSLEIITKDLFGPSLSSISIDNIFVSIWNTTRQSVLERMQLFTMDDFLKNGNFPT